MAAVLYPSVYELNTRVRLTELSRVLGRRATLDDIPDADLDRLTALGFDWVWLLSIWQTGLAGQRFSRTNPELRKELERTLPDLRDEDIPGSGFAITSYTVHSDFGGDAALAGLRRRLKARGIRLMLDFVPNHTALDHPWVEDHPEYFIRGDEDDLARSPANYMRVERKFGTLILAHGRDPYFPGWPDTLQLDYATSATQDAMTGELLKIADQCDGLRCDMAMLILPDVFQRTWGRHPPPFWPAAIDRIRKTVPGFVFMAEVYWDMEWTLQQLGFDFTYDKRLYDRLRDQKAPPVRDHLRAGLDYQNRLARFLENHDEPRAAASFPIDVHRAAAVVTYLSPGLRLFHDGQLDGRQVHVSVHLNRRPDEPINEEIARFYDRLLGLIRNPLLRQGAWQLLECAPAWDGNWTWDCFIAFLWQAPSRKLLLVVVNYAGNQSQCYVRLPIPGISETQWRLEDRLSSAAYQHNGKDLACRGLYLDMSPWQASAYSLIDGGQSH
jgi:hypothetical protein